jgi:hypothetical protein
VTPDIIDDVAKEFRLDVVTRLPEVNGTTGTAMKRRPEGHGGTDLGARSLFGTLPEASSGPRIGFGCADERGL